jgi:hypothetical protein
LRDGGDRLQRAVRRDVARIAFDLHRRASPRSLKVHLSGNRKAVHVDARVVAFRRVPGFERNQQVNRLRAFGRAETIQMLNEINAAATARNEASARGMTRLADAVVVYTSVTPDQ